jgi:glucose-6-phosphate isomerase
MLFGLDVEALRKGAQEVFITVFGARAGIPPAVEGAALNAAARDFGLTQAVLWPYTDRLERFAMWYRQLWAESLGKGGQGTTPIRALGPVDQHSQLQLYLDGPNDKLITLIDAPSGADAKANAAWATKHGLTLYAGRGMNEVVAAQTKAVAETLAGRGRAVRRITLDEPLNERGLGALLMHFMWETLLTARLWNVDPFGQPAVEDAKIKTRKFLSGEP